MKSLLLSDLHIGFKYSRAQEVVSILEKEKFDRLILVGDIFDIQQLMKRPYWDEHHTAVLKKILKIAKRKEVVYVIGNHDYPLYYLQEYTSKLAGINICREYKYESGDKTILCLHGDQLQKVSRRIQVVGDYAYYFGLSMNKYVNAIRRAFGLPYWSISKWGKDKVKTLIAKSFNMEADKLDALEHHQSDFLVYGHTHMPHVSDTSANCGSFVEIATYLVEKNGVFTLKDLDSN